MSAFKPKTINCIIQISNIRIEHLPNFVVLVFANWSYLVTEIHACGRVSYLWDVEELEEILHLDGHRAGSRSDQSHDGLLPLHQQAPCLDSAPALALLLLVGH